MLLCSGVPPVPPLRTVGALLGWGSPSPFPPLEATHVKCARPFRGELRLDLSSDRFPRRVRALWVFVPPPLPSSVPLFPPWLHSRPIRRSPLRWHDLPPLPPTLVCCTRGEGACHFQTWRRGCRPSGLAGAPCHHRPPPSPSSRLAPPLVCPYARRRRRWILPPWLLGRWVGFCLLPPVPGPSSPRWSWDAIRDPGVSNPPGPSTTLGVSAA